MNNEKRRTHGRGQLSKIVYARRAYLVESGKANWIPLYKYTVEHAIAKAGL